MARRRVADRVRFESADGASHASWHFADDSYSDSYTMSVDEAQNTISLTPTNESTAHPTGPMVLHYVQLDADHLELEANVNTQRLRVQVERFKPENQLLLTRGFHWINEEPFNR